MFSNGSQVVTYKNHALDNFLKDCLTKISSPDVKIVRVGRLAEDADDSLTKCLLREVCLKLTHKYIKKNAFCDHIASCQHDSVILTAVYSLLVNSCVLLF